MPTVDEKEYRDKIFRCPFCLADMKRICEIQSPFGDTHDGGQCECGAVFIYDRTGKNQGEAFAEAIAFAFDWDYDAVYERGELYEEAVVMYNSKFGKYLLTDGSALDRSARYFFVKALKGAKE